MSTLAIMKERISSELRRDDLASPSEFRVVSAVSDIHDAIITAVGAYTHEQFYFSQSRGDIVFNTVVGQDIYTSTDLAAISRIAKIDYGFITISGVACRLIPEFADVAEGGNLGSGALTGTPQFYAWYAEAIRIEPIPADVWSLRFGCWMNVAAPASDSEAGNRWMIDGERLIRCRAKAELYRHVIKDPNKADIMQASAQEALEQLRDLTAMKTQPEVAAVEAWDPY